MKKFIGLVLVVTIMFGATGCGGTPTASVNTSDSDANTEKTDESIESFTAITPQQAWITDFATNTTTKIIEEKTGVRIIPSLIPSDQMEQKISALLSSGKYPDAFIGCQISPSFELQYGVTDKYFIPLDDLIASGSPNLTSALTDPANPGATFESIKSVDGKIYSLPTINPCQHCLTSARAWINQTWLTKLNLPMPTTTDELYTTLEAFKTQDPNGNGKADELPLVTAQNGWHTGVDEFLPNAFLWFQPGFYGYQLDDNKKVINTLPSEEFKNYLAFMNKLYSNGLLYEGSLTQTIDQLTQLIENPDAAIVGMVEGGTIPSSSIGNDRYKDFRPLPPLKGSGGVQFAAAIPNYPNTGALAITDKAKNPNAIIKWANYLYSEEGSLLNMVGVEDVNWEKAPEGVKGFDGSQAMYVKLTPFDRVTPQNDAWYDIGVLNFTAKLRNGEGYDAKKTDMYSAQGLEYYLYDTCTNYYEPHLEIKYALPPLRFELEDNTKQAAISAQLKNYYDQMLFDFISGKKNIDTDWEANVQGLKALGLDELTALKQKAYDAVYGNK